MIKIFTRGWLALLLLLVNVSYTFAMPPHPLWQTKDEKKWVGHLTPIVTEYQGVRRIESSQLESIHFDIGSEYPRAFFNLYGNAPECVELRDGIPTERYMAIPHEIFEEYFSPTKRREFAYQLLKQKYQNNSLIYKVSPDMTWAVVGNKQGSIEILTDFNEDIAHALEICKMSLKRKEMQHSGSFRKKLDFSEAAGSESVNDDACVPVQQNHLTPRALFQD